MAIPSGFRNNPSAEAYNVTLLAFPAATGRTLQGLMQLFGIDEMAAQRLIASVPVTLSQEIGLREAEACAQALRKLGARVTVERAATAAEWSEPSPYEEELLPQPRAVPASNDSNLEYDMLSADAVPYGPEPSIAPSSIRDPLDMELSLSEPDRLAEDSAPRRQRNDDLDLQTGPAVRDGGALELDAVAPPEHRAVKPVETQRSRNEERQPAGGQTRPRAQEPVPAPVAPQESESTRTIALLQIGFAIAVVAVGYWLDSSVIFGTAGPWSVVAHGLALYQLALGIRGLVS
jgi:hypothetical protein